MLFELNGTFVIFIVSFLIFMVLLDQIMLKPVGRVLSERASLIEGSVTSARQLRGDAEKQLGQYEDRLKQVRQEAQAVISSSVAEANRLRTSELGRVNENGRQKLQAAKANIDAERESLIDALVAEEKELVETITRKVLGDESVHVNIDERQLRSTLEEAF
jgi:F-type H+-transporting ATPase subunit b